MDVPVQAFIALAKRSYDAQGKAATQPCSSNRERTEVRIDLVHDRA